MAMVAKQDFWEKIGVDRRLICFAGSRILGLQVIVASVDMFRVAEQ